MSVCCECCVLSGRGHCVGLITRTNSNYRTRLVSNTILNIQLALTDNYFGHICHFRHKSTFPAKIMTLGSKLKYRASGEPKEVMNEFNNGIQCKFWQWSVCIIYCGEAIRNSRLSVIVSVTALDISLVLIFIYCWRKRIISDTQIDSLAQTSIHSAILLNMKSSEIHIKHESKGKEVLKDNFITTVLVRRKTAFCLS